MIPEVLVSDELKRARNLAREFARHVASVSGCRAVAVVAEIAEGRACSSMAVDPTLDDDPDAELALMRCALTRALSLIVLHVGARRAMSMCVESLAAAARLACEAGEASDDAAC